ncbi:MAG: diaminopimelate decarboxylase [Bacillota bacterium]
MTVSKKETAADQPPALPPGQHVGQDGHLYLGGCDAVGLAKEFGTPLYVMDEEVLRSRCREYVQAVRRHYPARPGAMACYAGKAFLVMAMARLIDQEGLGLDVVSGGELQTALAAGFPPENITFHGSNKTPEEIRLGLEAGVGHFVVDNLEELNLIEEMAPRRRSAPRPRILLRITPGVQAHTHDYMATGVEDSKFGFTLREGIALEAARRAAASRRVALTGFACHIGSQILEVEPSRLAATRMMEFAAEVRAKTGFTASEIDLGGGMGVRYTAEDDPPTIDEYVGASADTIKAQAKRLGLPLPKLIFEMGRYLTADAGTTLYTVGGIKRIPGIRTYASVDGGMTDNPRLALYGAIYDAVLADRVNRAATRVYAIAGRNCESGDMLIWRAKLPTLKAGDTLAVLCTGAYNYAMASHYNRVPNPAVVFVRKGQVDLIVRRETYADVMANDILPERMQAGERNEAVSGHSS